jgi:hypothetical protein
MFVHWAFALEDIDLQNALILALFGSFGSKSCPMEKNLSTILMEIQTLSK